MQANSSRNLHERFDRTSGNVVKRKRYRSSARFARRSERAMFREAGGYDHVPEILGMRTPLLCLIAKYGPMPRQALTVVATDGILQNLVHTDGAGMLVQWRLKHTYGIELNPQFPLYEELRQFLVTFGDLHGIALDPPPEQLKKRKRIQRPIDLDHLLFSTVRTKLLAALELHDGAARRLALMGTVPGHARRDFDIPLRFLINSGIIEKRDGKVAFCNAPWTLSLRRLLRGYLRLNPQFVREARERIKRFESAATERAVHGLFGRRASERMLAVLAVNGPMGLSALCDASGREQYEGLYNLESDRIVVRKYRGKFVTISLNADHPVHDELVALLCAMSRTKPAADRPPDLHGGKRECDLTHLFGFDLKLDIFGTIAASGEIDASSFHRLHSQYTKPSIDERLIELKQLGILKMRRVGVLNLYRFNPAYRHAEKVAALAKKIVGMRPRYRTLAAVEHELFNPLRRKIQEKVIASRPRDLQNRPGF